MEFDNSKSLLNVKTSASPIGVGDGLVADPELVRRLNSPGGLSEPEANSSEPKSTPSSSGTKSNSSSGTDESKKEKVGETGVKSIAQTIMDIAAEMGGQAQTEAKKIAERDVLLSQLFTKYGGNEQDVIDFINKSLFEVQLSHEELIDLTNITNQASTKSGQKLKDINNFALEHIRRIQNPELTKTVIEEASSLKSMFRNIPIFEILANDLSPGSYPNAEQYIDNPLMFGKDPANFLLFQELRGMIVQRNAEQVELIRREFQIKLRQKQKAIEVANRKRAIVDMMESIEYLNAETAAVNKISEIFQASVLNPNVKMFRRLFRDLKAAQVLRDEFVAGMQFKGTDIAYEEFRKTQPNAPRVPTVRGSAAENNIVVAQTIKPTPLAKPAAMTPPVDKTTADNTFNKNKNLVNRMITNQVTDARKALQAIKNRPELVGMSATLSRLITQLEGIRSNLPQMDSLTFTNKFFPIINQTGIELKLQAEQLTKIAPKKANSNKFVKVAAPPFPTPATSGPNIATYNPNADPWIEGGLVVLAGSSFLATLAQGDLAGAAGIAAGAWLLYQQNMALKVRAITGRPLPKNLLTPKQAKQAQISFEQIGASASEAQTLITLKQYRDNAKEVITGLESSLMSRIEGEVNRGRSATTIASAPPEEMKKDFNQFINFLNNAIKVIQYENSLVDTLRQKALNKIVKINPTASANLMAYKAEIMQDLRTFFLEKKRKYSSFALVVDNYIKSSRVMTFIRRELPFLQNLMNASSSSVADMVLGGVGQGNKGGLLGAIDNAIDIEKNNVEKLQAAVTKKDPKAFQNFYGKNLENFRSPSMALDNPVQPVPKLQVTEIPKPSTASNIFDNFRFSNMIVESQTAPPSIPSGTTPASDSSTVIDPQLKNKANEKLANILNKMNYTYEHINLNIPYVELQNDPINMRVIQGHIDSITDPKLRDAVSQKLKQKLDENKSLAAQVKTDKAKEMIEQVGLEKFYRLISESPGILADVSPSPETQAQDDEADIPSLMEQYNVSLQNLAKLEGVRMQLLRNPSDLGALSSIVGARSDNKFVKIAKEDPKEEVYEYWDELLPGYGDILEDPEEYLDQTVQEVEEEEKKKNPKHNK